MSELAAESAQRKQAGRRASALLDAEQASRVSAVKAEEDQAKAERVSNQRRASAMMDLEQAARIQKIKLEEEMDSIERKSNQRRASNSMDMEQKRRIAEAAAEEEAEKVERRKSQAAAAAALDAEQSRRVSEASASEVSLSLERTSAGASALKQMDLERDRRASEKQPRSSLVKDAGVLDELQEEVDESESYAVVGDAKGLGSEPAEKVNISVKASANVGDIMGKDAGDESLRKYKENLLGKAAKGDLGDTADPRKVVVTEFRVVFEDKKVPDVVYDLSTDEGVKVMQDKGLKIKEGSGFKFELSFRVNHEILTGLKFVNRTRKGIFGQTESLVIGSFAPASDPYKFVFPRYGYNEAPAGMMYRGSYKATDKFVDSDGNLHLSYDYKVQITK
ncbi:hypothetical protein TrCOL_g11350 [Triparma columacea]|uniref:Uncharacterized protein n=1 Tax=Triparma columacea TaxID=722753 RepID=A0A9W7GG03_9STRA|nr:hypothetical protein TrCOL_g11350 [Triparma columacea]